jgi:endonuclease IV
MKYGLKLWSTNVDMIPEAIQLVKDGTFNYIEIACIPGSPVEPFMRYDGECYMHVAHEQFGFNGGDKACKDKNAALVQEAVAWANIMHAKGIIVHPGHGSFDECFDFFASMTDDRILVENMPFLGIKRESMVGYDVDRIRTLMLDKFGFCFDVSHAIKAAISLKVDVVKFLEGFRMLAPNYFHFSDARVTNEMDEHLNIGEGEYDFSMIKSRIDWNVDSHVTLETPKTKGSLRGDVQNVTKLRAIMAYIEEQRGLHQ